MKVLIIDVEEFADFAKECSEHIPTVDFRKTLQNDRHILRVRLPDQTPHSVRDRLKEAFDIREQLTRHEVDFIEAVW